LQHLQDCASHQQHGQGQGAVQPGDLLPLLQAISDRARIAEGLLFMVSCLVENINDPVRMTPTASPSSSPVVGPRFTTALGDNAPRAASINGSLNITLANGGRKSSFRTAKDCLASKYNDGSAHQPHLTWFDDLSSITGMIAQVQSQLHNVQTTWAADPQLAPSFPAIELRFLELWDAAAVAARHSIGMCHTQ
jgi:hypothetical protein